MNVILGVIITALTMTMWIFFNLSKHTFNSPLGALGSVLTLGAIMVIIGLMD